MFKLIFALLFWTASYGYCLAKDTNSTYFSRIDSASTAKQKRNCTSFFKKIFGRNKKEFQKDTTAFKSKHKKGGDSTVIAQKKVKDDNRYLITLLDGKKFDDIYNYLNSACKLGDEQQNTIVLRKLVEDSLFCGIHRFKIASNVALPYIYFLNSDSTKEFVNDYNTDSVLRPLQNK